MADFMFFSGPYAVAASAITAATADHMILFTT